MKKLLTLFATIALTAVCVTPTPLYAADVTNGKDEMKLYQMLLLRSMVHPMHRCLKRFSQYKKDNQSNYFKI